MQATQLPQRDYATEKKVFDLIQAANARTNSGDAAGAIQIFKDAAAEDPTSYSAMVHLNLANCERTIQRYDDAIADAKRAYQLDPTLSTALYTTALIYHDMGNSKQAIDYLNRYIKTSRDSGSTESARSLVKQIAVYDDLKAAEKESQNRHYDSAAKLLEHAASYDPSQFSAAVHISLGLAYMHEHHNDQALKEAETAYHLNPRDKDIVYTLALAQGNTLKFDEAVQTLKQYLTLETDQQRRANASKTIQMLESDKARFNDPASRAPDYCDKDQWHIRWPQASMPVKVYISPGVDVRGYKESWASFVPYSLDAWCNASGNKIDYKIVHSPEDADIKVVWTTEDLPDSEDHPGVRAAGLTEYNHDDSGKLRVKVSVRTVSPFDNQLVFSDGEVEHVCLHELGHSLGIQHSTAMRDVMYFRASEAESDQLTGRDKATIARYYEEYPVLAFVPHSVVQNVPKSSPPPTFMPPKPTDLNKLIPPMFLPPPIQQENKKLQPPMFVPPPAKSAPAQENRPAPPTFLPPPVQKKKESGSPDGLFFTPPPK